MNELSFSKKLVTHTRVDHLPLTVGSTLEHGVKNGQQGPPIDSIDSPILKNASEK